MVNLKHDLDDTDLELLRRLAKEEHPVTTSTLCTREPILPGDPYGGMGSKLNRLSGLGLVEKTGSEKRKDGLYANLLRLTTAGAQALAGEAEAAHLGPPECRWCHKPLEGRGVMFCRGPGTSCKQRHHAFQQSLDRLAQLPEPEFRELLRGVCQQRYFTPWKRGGRLHIRWGVYSPSQESPEDRCRRLATWEEVDPEVKKLGNLHVWQGNVARRLSWIVQYLRLLDRGAKLERDRKEREGRKP